MKVHNTRLFQAAEVLISDVGDVKSRVVIACKILSALGSFELDPILMSRLKNVLLKAGYKGPLVNAEGFILRDRFEHTARNRLNKSYILLAKEIFSIYEADLSNKVTH